MTDESFNTTHNVRTCPCDVCRVIQGKHEAFVRGLKRGLELAKEHAELDIYEDSRGVSIDWKAADEAVAKESK